MNGRTENELTQLILSFSSFAILMAHHIDIARHVKSLFSFRIKGEIKRIF